MCAWGGVLLGQAVCQPTVSAMSLATCRTQEVSARRTYQGNACFQCVRAWLAPSSLEMFSPEKYHVPRQLLSKPVLSLSPQSSGGSSVPCEGTAKHSPRAPVSAHAVLLQASVVLSQCHRGSLACETQKAHAAAHPVLTCCPGAGLARPWSCSPALLGREGLRRTSVWILLQGQERASAQRPPQSVPRLLVGVQADSMLWPSQLPHVSNRRSSWGLPGQGERANGGAE